MLSDFGLDSVGFTRLANRINDRFGLNMTPTVFFEHPTLSELTAHLLAEYREAVREILMPAHSLAPQAGLGSETAVSGRIGSNDIATPIAARAQAQSQGMGSDADLAETPSQTIAPGEGLSGPSGQSGESTGAEPIAVVGMTGCFPQSGDLEAFWHNLLHGRDGISDIPTGRWDWSEVARDFGADPYQAGLTKAGAIQGIDEFDPLFFGIAPREARLMDPQQRLAMMQVWHVIEDAGYAPSSLSGTNTGLFIGTDSSGYAGMFRAAGGPVDGASGPAMVASIGPNRMSYFLNLHGPSEPIETACSSSLVALHRAVEALRQGQCDYAIAGGVNTLVASDPHVSFAKAGMLAPDGRCKTFAADADGYVRGEGMGMVMLKPLSAAERDGDRVEGLIRGSAENHGGRANSLTAPNPRAQADVIKAALARAGVGAETLSYVEAHGTGTPLGDPIEIQGLKTAFEEASSSEPVAGQCGLGSVKTNIGHLELAAGIAGVLKVLLQMRHGQLAPTRNCGERNPYIEIENTPLRIVDDAQDWPRLRDNAGHQVPRRAGVSSFGFGGVNAHVVLEEYERQGPSVAATPSQPQVVVLSARNHERLRAYAEAMLGYLDSHEVDLEALAYTLQVGREAMEARMGCVVADIDELRERLRRYGRDGARIAGFHVGQSQSSAASSVYDGVTLDASWGREHLESALQHWVAGGTVDWGWQRRAHHPTPISLPVYPFAAEAYWVPNGAAVADEANPHSVARADGLGDETWELIERVEAGHLSASEAIERFGAELE